MSFALERKLIEAAYKTGMGANAVIDYGNDDFVAPAAGFTRITILGGEGRLKELTATSSSRTPGVIDVAIFVPAKSGTAGLRAIADTVSTVLANKTLSESSTTIRTFGAGLQIIGRSGDWFQGNVTIRFERDSQ